MWSSGLVLFLTYLPRVFNMQIALVTGGNKGIGREVAHIMSSPPYSVTTIIACRNEALGQRAADELKGLGCNIIFHKLDLTDPESITKTRDFIACEFGHLDILVNNAAICFNDPTLYGKCEYTPFNQQARITIDTNFFGTLRVVRTMLPLLRSSTSPRIINMASSAGRLSQLSRLPDMLELVTSPDVQMGQLEIMMECFVNDVETGIHQQRGWPNTCYGMSKVGVIAMSKILARDEKKIMVNCVDPGYCATDQNNNQGFIIARQGAAMPVKLATMCAEMFLSGSYLYYDGSEIKW